MNGLFNKKISHACEYCKHGKTNASNTQILCFKKGIMDFNSSCSSYKYDPLKRKPRAKPTLPKYTADDFKL